MQCIMEFLRIFENFQINSNVRILLGVVWILDNSLIENFGISFAPPIFCISPKLEMLEI